MKRAQCTPRGAVMQFVLEANQNERNMASKLRDQLTEQEAKHALVARDKKAAEQSSFLELVNLRCILDRSLHENIVIRLHNN
ncbi:hypothetical protein NDU88_002947 [Pleurodeles waltl]|uniref:Uncharacterized protein n=1 Tax=Pleurodeles waltl TaxID=8319 RepID=A0AAV7TMP3_PLEWA|nr:hypothetical protein NDU88_002947 [Pleurodeles waltl]